MPKKEPNEITLGGEKFTLEVPTFDQLQLILAEQDNVALATRETDKVRAGLAIVAIMVGKDLSVIRGTVAEVVDAMPVVMRVSGLEEMGRRAEAESKKAKAAAAS